MLTDAYNLPAKKVVHIVGSMVSGSFTADLEKKLDRRAAQIAVETVEE